MKNFKIYNIWILVFFIIIWSNIIFSGCEEQNVDPNNDQTNSFLVIDSLIATKQNIYLGDTTEIVCYTSNPEEDTSYYYAWNNGTITDQNSTTLHHDKSGKHFVSVTVKNAKNGPVSAQIPIYVKESSIDFNQLQTFLNNTKNYVTKNSQGVYK